MNSSIQFLICQDGASAKYLGINPVKGLQRLDINAEYWFMSRNTGEIHLVPDYVFCLKPNTDNLSGCGHWEQYMYNCRQRGGKLILIINDQRLPIGIEKIFDFFVSPSLDWQKEYQKRHSNKPCYLINEEIDYYTTKIHKPSKELKIVTTGYSINLIKHFLPIVPMIKEVTNDITVITNSDFDRFANVGCNVKTFIPHYSQMLNEDYDKLMVEQFKDYDVGIVTQYNYGIGRTSNRVKLLNYAGLPVVCTNSANHRDLWFTGETNRNLKVIEEIDWITHLVYLQNYKRRQCISNYHSGLQSQNAGIIKSGKSFLEAIKQYENSH